MEPKTATSPCVHFEVAASSTEKNTSLLHVSIFSRLDIVEKIGPNTREIISLASSDWTTDYSKESGSYWPELWVRKAVQTICLVMPKNQFGPIELLFYSDLIVEISHCC